VELDGADLKMTTLAAILVSLISVFILFLLIAAHSWTKNYWTDPNTWIWIAALTICTTIAVILWILRNLLPPPL